MSDAEVVEVPFTAFTGRRKADHITARLVVRRVRRLNPTNTDHGTEQTELFAGYRYDAVFTDSPLSMLDAESCHRGHAIVEHVIADLKAGPLAHLPSGKFTANAAWLVLAAMAFNLTRAAGCLAGTPHTRATTATLRWRLIAVPARTARSARRLVLHCRPAGHADHPPPQPPDHPAPPGATGDQQWKSRTDRQPPRTNRVPTAAVRNQTPNTPRGITSTESHRWIRAERNDEGVPRTWATVVRRPAHQLWLEHRNRGSVPADDQATAEARAS